MKHGKQHIDDNEENENYSDDQIVNLIQDEIRMSNTEFESSVAAQREQAHKYYYGKELGNEITGRSQHVSMEVFDAVENMKATMTEVFSASNNICRFDPMGDDDLELSEDATGYVNTVFYRENPGHKTLQDCFHDGLLTKRAVIKRYWKTDEQKTPENFEGVTEEQLNMVLSQPDVEFVSLEEPEEVEGMYTVQGQPTRQGTQQMLSGVINRIQDTSRIVVEVVEPENFYHSGRADSLAETDFTAQEHEYSVSDLIGMGFDRDLVEGIGFNDSIGFDIEEYARNSVDDSFYWNDHSNAKERRAIRCWECYMQLDLDDDGEAEWSRFFVIGNKLAETETVMGHPYRDWNPIPISHKALGLSLADVTMDIQKTNSTLYRAIIDNAVMTTRSRSVANMRLIKNPKDLIDGKIGAIIQCDGDPRMAITPLAEPQIPGQTYQLLEMLNQQREGRTGQSRLAAGMNSDAISHQNADDMVERLTNAGNRRPMMVCRGFAETFLKPLMLDIYMLGRENEQPRPMMISGKYKQVDMSQWPERKEMSVEVALTPDEHAAQAQAMLTTHGMMMQDPMIAPLYGLKQRYATYNKVFELMSIDSSPYLANPEDPQVQQQMQQEQQQQQQQQQQMQQMQMAMQQMQMQLAKQSADTDRMKVQGELSIKAQSNLANATQHQDDYTLEVQQQNHKEEMDEKEYYLEKTQQRGVDI